jgi:hydroxyacylglutathione hydrolase
MNLLPLPAFSDNYVWMLHDDKVAIVIDPGAPEPVLQTLDRLGIALQAILVTHHHSDHVGGVSVLRETSSAIVYGPARERIPTPFEPVQQDTCIHLPALNLSLRVLDIPGHTAGHVAYYAEPAGQAPLLFCGDALFSGGCGRVFEGTPAQMSASLQALAALPPETRICCAHEYTLSNLKFARAVEPDNPALLHHSAQCEQLRAQQQPTLPSTLGLELQINPFLRTHIAAVIKAARGFDPSIDPTDAVAVFAALREWKNKF